MLVLFFLTELLRVFAPTIILPMDVRTSFYSNGPTGSGTLTDDCGVRERSRSIQISVHSASGHLICFGVSSIFTRVSAHTASQASPAQSGSREITSSTLAAVMCDAEEPCSVNTAWNPESSFTASPRNTTRPMYFWGFLSSQVFLR